jgi:catechol 2,3-dioxygenase-like lactoylglutathione lyase family enzyme
MFTFPKIFHVSHLVDDLPTARAWYQDVFAPVAWQDTELMGTSLALLVVGDVVMMPMQPRPGSSTDRYKTRMGQRLHSLALYVDEPVPMIEHLRGQGFRLTGSAGTELENPDDEIWTQPRESPMVFELFRPRESMDDPRINDPEWSSDFWRDEHPLGLVSAFSTCVTPDAAVATKFFVDSLLGAVVHEAVTPYGTRSTFVRLSDEVVLEAAQPIESDSDAARDLEAGGRFHAVTYRVVDLDRAAAHFESKGVRAKQVADGHVMLDPADTFGARLRLTDRDVTDW